MSTSSYRISPESLIRVCAVILQHYGTSPSDAKMVADSLIEADLRGISSHGVLRLPIYIKRLQQGLVFAKVEPKVINETPNTAVMDGRDGLGQIVADRAMALCIQKAKGNHIGAVTVRNSSHFGAAAYWAMKALDHDMIGIAVSNTTPLMPVPGGAEARTGNNPIAVAVPADREYPIVLDMATSVVALGKVLLAQKKGDAVPLGWGVDEKGHDTTDPADILDGGFILPVGGPKGYGLAILVDILSGLLSQGATGSAVKSLYHDFTEPNHVGHFFLAIQVGAFLDPVLFKQSVDRYVQYIKATRKTPGVHEVYLPGEPEFRRRQAQAAEGLILPSSLIEDVVSLGREADVEARWLDELTREPLA